jgi:hypothetical protein
MSETNETPSASSTPACCYSGLLNIFISHLITSTSTLRLHPSSLPFSKYNEIPPWTAERSYLTTFKNHYRARQAGSASATEITFLDPYLLHPTHTSPIFVLCRSPTSRCFWLVLPPSGPCILQVCLVKSEFPFLSCSYVCSDYLPPKRDRLL